jgi:hypothetical protein
MGKMRNILKNLIVKSKLRSPVGRPRSRWEDNIKLNGS